MILFPGDLASQSTNQMDPAKKKIIEELVKKHKGEEAERQALFSLVQLYGQEVGTLILGQKSNMDLIEQTMKQELVADFPDERDRGIKTVEKVAETVGLDLGMPKIEKETKNIMDEFFGNPGMSSIADMSFAVQNSANPSNLNKFERKQREKGQKMLLKILSNPNLINMSFDARLKCIFKDVKYDLMRKELNRNKKEHDIVFIKPEHKTVAHSEVKAIQDNKTREVTNALKQLEGGKKEMARIHGHVLDAEWTYIGVVCLPNLLPNQKSTICQNLRICTACADYILVGDQNASLKPAMASLLKNHFSTAPLYQGSTMWLQYKKLTSRMLAMEHLTLPVSSLKRITGREEPVVAAFTKGVNCESHYLLLSTLFLSGDLMFDPALATDQKLQTWKKEKHVGCPASILFLTKEQLQLWREKHVMLLADYSTGVEF